MDTGVSVLEVFWNTELFLWKELLLAGGVVTGVCGTAVVLTEVTGTGFVGMGID